MHYAHPILCSISHCLAVYVDQWRSQVHADALSKSADAHKTAVSCSSQAKRSVSLHRLGVKWIRLLYARVFACSNLDLEICGFRSFSQSLSASFPVHKFRCHLDSEGRLSLCARPQYRCGSLQRHTASGDQLNGSLQSPSWLSAARDGGLTYQLSQCSTKGLEKGDDRRPHGDEN
jgi:hypothetical protein